MMRCANTVCGDVERVGLVAAAVGGWRAREAREAAEVMRCATLFDGDVERVGFVAAAVGVGGRWRRGRRRR